MSAYNANMCTFNATHECEKQANTDVDLHGATWQEGRVRLTTWERDPPSRQPFAKEGSCHQLLPLSLMSTSDRPEILQTEKTEQRNRRSLMRNRVHVMVDGMFYDVYQSYLLFGLPLLIHRWLSK